MTVVSPEELSRATKALHRSLDAEQTRLLAVYLDQLTLWNRRMNLVGPSDWRRILETLVQDSWYLADFLHARVPQAQLTLDIGAGAGLPGIPLRMLWKTGTYILVEPRQKRAIFLEHALFALRLPRTQALRARMEELPPEYRQADLLVSRAFRPWRELLESAAACLAPDGKVVVMSSEDLRGETADEYTTVCGLEYEIAGKKHFLTLFSRFQQK